MSQLSLPMALPAERDPPRRPDVGRLVHPDALLAIRAILADHPGLARLMEDRLLEALAGGRACAVHALRRLIDSYERRHHKGWAGVCLTLLEALERDYDSAPDWRPAEMLPEDHYALGGSP